MRTSRTLLTIAGTLDARAHDDLPVLRHTRLRFRVNSRILYHFDRMPWGQKLGQN